VRRIVIASQLTEQFHTGFLAAVSNVEIVPIKRGPAPMPPPEAEVMFGSPFHRTGADNKYPPPPGWPFGLKWIQLISAGVDHYPGWLFGGPPVTSARGVSSLALAEFALGAIFAATKRMPDIWIHEHAAWKTLRLKLVEGATLGIVGFGAIGEALAPKARALGMKVIAVRRSGAPMAPGVERAADLADLFARSDHVVIAAPATAETHHMVNADILARAKAGVHIINVARGTIIDDRALLAALESGQVSLASLDCTDPEPLPEGHAFYTHPRIHLSPHTSTYTPDAQPNLIVKFARNLARYRNGEPLEDVVDPKAGY
jgi:phosphoglycerate dehydrogenase-like enzyme